MTIANQIRSMVRMVARDERHIGVLSVGECIAVALVLGRCDLLPASFPHVLDAIDRLGLDWYRATLEVHREGWRE